MRRSRFAVRTFIRLLLVSVVLTLLMAASSIIVMRRLYGEAAGFSLSQAAASLASLASQSMEAVPAFCEDAARGSRLRVTLIGVDGTVLGDSRSDFAAMENHANRPEVIQALKGQNVTTFRTSSTLGINMAYAAAPVRLNDRVIGVLRVAMDAPDLADRLAPLVWMAVALACLFIAAMAAVSARLGASVMWPVEALMSAAEHWSSGRLDIRVPPCHDADLAGLTTTMNRMAAELADRIRAMERQQGELAAILDGMDEAVIALDGDLSIRRVNRRARELLKLGEDSSPGLIHGFHGRPLLQACGSGSLEALARSCIEKLAPQDGEINLYGDTTSTVLVYAAPLASEDGRLGAVLVLNDITRIKSLERVRRDFVANVSHELRTPITLIKGFIETLEDGVIKNPAEAGRFIGIIKRHADRLASIVEDLLSLARIESPGRGQLLMHLCQIKDIINKALESLGDRPGAKAVSILVDCPQELEVEANEGLLEQALVNLLDNAVKYGPEGGTVWVQASRDESAGLISLSIRDEGQGIPARDLPRLFERFYRVDRARSRELGGTGLGLAIVRHIAMAHGGTVSVQSKEGYGSTFYLKLPTSPLSIHSKPPSTDTAATST